MSSITLVTPNIHDYLSGRMLSVIMTDRNILFLKTRSEVGIFVDWHETGPYVKRVMEHREYMVSPMYGFTEVTWRQFLYGRRVAATLTDGRHLVIQKDNGEMAWIGWSRHQGPYFVKQDAHTELFGHGLESIADLFMRNAYRRRQL